MTECTQTPVEWALLFESEIHFRCSSCRLLDIARASRLYGSFTSDGTATTSNYLQINIQQVLVQFQAVSVFSVLTGAKVAKKKGT